MNTIEASERYANSRRWRVARQRDWSYKHKTGRNGQGSEAPAPLPAPRLPRAGLGAAGAYD